MCVGQAAAGPGGTYMFSEVQTWVTRGVLLCGFLGMLLQPEETLAKSLRTNQLSARTVKLGYVRSMLFIHLHSSSSAPRSLERVRSGEGERKMSVWCGVVCCVCDRYCRFGKSSMLIQTLGHPAPACLSVATSASRFRRPQLSCTATKQGG